MTQKHGHKRAQNTYKALSAKVMREPQEKLNTNRIHQEPRKNY